MRTAPFSTVRSAFRAYSSQMGQMVDGFVRPEPSGRPQPHSSASSRRTKKPGVIAARLPHLLRVPEPLTSRGKSEPWENAMKRAVGLFIILANCAMSGCYRTSDPATQSKAGLTGEPIDQVVLRVKQEIGLFQAQSTTWHAGLTEEFKRLGITPQCGTGDINFGIKSVKIEFVTILDKSESGELSLKIPFGSGDVGPSTKGTFETKGTNTLDYTYYVPDSPGKLNSAAMESIKPYAVIAPTLSALRDGLVRATAQLPV